MGRQPTLMTTSTTTEDPRSSTEIKHDIENVRGEMDETLDRLNEQLSPRALINGVLDWFDSRKRSSTARRAKRASGEALNFIRDNPLPVLLTGAGVAWLIAEARDSDGDMSDYEYAYDHPRSRGVIPEADPYDVNHTAPYSGDGPATASEPGIMEKAQAKASEVGHAIGDAAESAKAKVSNVADELKSQAGSAHASMSRQVARGKQRGRRLSRQVQSGYAEAEERFRDAVDDYPLAVGAGFLGLGLMAGLLLPRTQTEDEMLGEASDELVDAARAKGEDLLERGKAVAGKVADKAMEEAEKQGLTGDKATSAAKDLSAKVGAVTEAAKKEARQAAKEEALTGKSLKREGTEAGAKFEDSAARKANQF